MHRLRIPALAVTALVMAAAVAFGSAQADTRAAAAEGPITIRLWDHFQPLTAAHDAILEQIKKRHPNVTVEHTVYNPATMPQSLQLAFKSGQLPDITSNVTGVPASKLIDEGWYIPIDQYVDVRRNKLVADQLFEGLTVFKGKVYSVPIFSRRQSPSTLWYNKDMLKAAGVDPEKGLVTYDDVLKAARAMTRGDAYGIVIQVKFTDRMADTLDDLAMAAGGPGPIDWRSGGYQYATEPYVKALEFLLKFKEQGSMFPASITLDARNARARWAAGNIGFFFDGPWNTGVIVNSFKDAAAFTDVAWVPVPSASAPGRTYKSPPGGEFWLTSQGKNPKVAAEFFEGLTTEDYYKALALGQDQPPLDIGAVAKAAVHASYTRVNGLAGPRVLISPVPQIRNSEVASVITEMKPITPNLGDIIMGSFSGAITDVRGALKTYNDAMTAERDRAIASVQAKGGKVSKADWVFANWDPARDYTPDMYKK
jgi:multiple sugar transport system substrate-binding protein